MKWLKKFSGSFTVFLCSLSIVLSGIISPLNQINSFASTTTSSGAAGDWNGHQVADWVTNHLMWIAAEGFDFVANGTILDGLGSKVATKVEELVHDNPLYTDYDDWWSRHFFVLPKDGVNTQTQSPNDFNVQNVHWDQSVTNVFNQAITELIQENPLTYTECKISSYSYIDSSYFSNYTQYKNFLEIMKQSDLIFVHTSSPGWNNQYKYLMFVTVDRSVYDVNFYGSTVGGVFTSVSLEHNWANLASFPENTNGIVYYFTEYNSTKIGRGSNIVAAQIDYWGNDHLYRDVPGLNGTIKNNTGIGLNNTTTVYTGKTHDELVYVFSTLNAYKNYNSGSPQPYYLGSGFGSVSGDVYIDNSNFSYNYYQNIVDQSKTGMTPDEVLELIDKIIGSGGGGSGGGGSGGSGNPFDFLGTIGEAVGNLIGGIGDFIAEVIGGIVNAILDLINMFVGEDGILSKLSNLISSGFNTFLSNIFSWLPSEVVTCFTACLVVGVFFAIWRIIRG